jgi:Ran GTPase-activating protein (RanGAP) involved in mRNA processing and transport
VLSREKLQQLTGVLRRNMALESVDMRLSRLWSAGLAEIAPVLYRNASIKSLHLSHNALDEIESANVLGELIRRNKTIAGLCVASNGFGRDAIAARSNADGVRSNTALQNLGLNWCGLDDKGILLLVDALGTPRT